MHTMYGIVNKAFHELIVQHHGEDQWLSIREKAAVDVDFFLTNEPYPDEITYSLVMASSEVLQVPVNTILEDLGKHWILKTGKNSYGALLSSGGANFKDFVLNLPNFHSRVMLVYPKLSPPEFVTRTLGSHQLELEYHSERVGLTYFMLGLLKGLGEMFHTAINIHITKQKSEGHPFDLFIITILN